MSFTSESFLGFIDELEDKVEAVKQLGQDIDYETAPYSQEQIQQLANLRGAEVTYEQLNDTDSLLGAIMPEG